MTDKLPARWRTWQREREAALVAFGVPAATAAHVAEIGARTRAWAAEQVGFRAATDARLILTETPDGRTLFHLALDPSVMPRARREAARRVLGATRIA